MTLQKATGNIIASKMADRKRQMCAPDEISNYLDDLESGFDMSSRSGDNKDFQSKYF